MLAAIYGGKIAARNIRADVAGSVEKLGRLSDEERENLTVSPRFSLSLRDALLSALGMVRSEADLKRSLSAVDALEPRTAAECGCLTLGRAMLLSALARKESRGAHCRADFPERDEAFHKTTVATIADGEIAVGFQAIPERRAEP